ncbi:MAG TPA: PIG-L family deacetylase [Kineosporiaceae bacterium]|nr:PIG-L family deacetylase [Kineosporiaceae bacterium]
MPDPGVLNIVAHEDDDLLFLAPDLADWIAAGLPSRTVFCTAGEYNGLPGVGREQYAANREDGIRAAYAQMAGVADDWRREVLAVGTTPVELDTLTAAPNVQVLFLCLPDGGDNLQLAALPNLWSGAYPTVHTIVPVGSPVTASVTYTKPGLIAMLTALLGRFSPGVIRTQDPLPDVHLHGDHADHVAVANFVRAAVRGWRRPDGHTLLVHHRDYAIMDTTPNLTEAQAEAKLGVFDTYAAHDPLASGTAWYRAMRYRFSPGVSWLGTDADGRLEAFAVLDGDVLDWYEDSPGGAWLGPARMGAGMVAQRVSVSATHDGRLQVFALRVDAHDIITAHQTPPSLAFSGWTSLGNPDGPGAPYTGMPAAARNADGRLEVWCRNSNGGLSTCFQHTLDGPFGGWLDLGGGPYLSDEAPAVVTDAQDRLHVFAMGRDGVVHWYQNAPNGAMVLDAAWSTDPPAATPSAVRLADGRGAVVVRRAVDGALLLAVESAADGSWTSTFTDLDGPGGYGEPALACAADGRLVVVARAPGGSLVTDHQAEVDGPVTGAWTDLGLITPALPALAAGADGRLCLFAIGADGGIVLARQTAADAGAPFGSWESVTA